MINKKITKKPITVKVKVPKTKLTKPPKSGPVGTSAQKGALGATSGY